jgi:predicted  nucleic acid-binding Zn-ribbon protein
LQYKLLEKEKRQLETKLDKLDKLSRALQQERSELQTTIKNLSKPASAITSSTENDSSTPVAGLNSSKQQI